MIQNNAYLPKVRELKHTGLNKPTDVSQAEGTATSKQVMFKKQKKVFYQFVKKGNFNLFGQYFTSITTHKV